MVTFYIHSQNPVGIENIKKTIYKMIIKANKIIKKNSETGDFHPDKSTGVAIGKMEDVSILPFSLYLVLYDDDNHIDKIKYPVFTVNTKLDIKEEIEYEISKELEDYLVYINETYFNFKFERI